MNHDRENVRSGSRAAGAVLETLPPSYAVCCTHCGRSFALRARLIQTIHIRCAGCGKLFMARAGGEAAEKAETPPVATAHGVAARIRRGTKSRKPPVSTLRKRIALSVGVIAAAFLLGLLWPSIFPNRVRHQWDVEVGMNGGKKATFALYGSSENRIHLVYSSFDGGPVSVASQWTCHRDDAWTLPPDPTKGSFPLGIGFQRAGVQWEIRFCGEGRARIDSADKAFTGTVVRASVPP
jgi:hypothetical protein